MVNEPLDVTQVLIDKKNPDFPTPFETLIISQ